MPSPAKADSGRRPQDPPTPAEVEALALEYHGLEEKILGIQKKCEEDMAEPCARRRELRELLIAKVREFGSAHAEKSKLLHGLEWEVMGSFGSTTKLDGAAVETFRLALLKEKKTRLLKRVFDKVIRWSLADTAGAFLRSEHEAGKFPDRLYALFARCSVSAELTPRLEVRPKKSA